MVCSISIDPVTLVSLYSSWGYYVPFLLRSKAKTMMEILGFWSWPKLETSPIISYYIHLHKSAISISYCLSHENPPQFRTTEFHQSFGCWSIQKHLRHGQKDDPPYGHGFQICGARDGLVQWIQVDLLGTTILTHTQMNWKRVCEAQRFVPLKAIRML